MLTQKKLAIIVENSLPGLKALNQALSNLGYTTELIAHPSQVIGMQNQVDLVFIEINIPVLGGYEFLRRLRTMGFNNPIIAHTAFPIKLDHILQAGFDGLVSKPLKVDKLPMYLEKISNQEAIEESI